ncbi:non-ribosomal peptide synthetase [Streptomyces sp. NPDC002265]|uniref:non-ribosomal peptide synthetase n=1 Tax=Streptomyces sp. NPDC002265 TaxID=3154415 RepID=UPI003326CCB5
METIPRWTTAPVPGMATYEVPLPRPVPRSEQVPPSAHVLPSEQVPPSEHVPSEHVLLAAHAKVLAALSGEHEVTIRFVPAKGEEPVAHRLSAGPGSWRALMESAAPGGDPAAETVLDPYGVHDGADDAVLHVSVHDGRLRLRYRTDVLDARAAERIAGYHLTALALIDADPEADHTTRSLLSDAEVRHQLTELAGPSRELPDRRVHELFEERVALHPDAIAAVEGDRQWTYRELDSRANRIGRALLARGLRREGVVAVVMERDLEWMAAVLGVLKAGGVYLPVEPHFPAERIAAVLSRAGCELVVGERGSTDTLDRAAVDARTVLVDTVWAEVHDDSALGVEVEAGQLAYIYFTSGSTGEPKGAMCEHAGFLNHLLAKIDDLGIEAGQTVAQTAPQCFDISLWQLLAGPVAGGRTLLVGQETILDVPLFVDTVQRAGVHVLQVVPSYLDAVLAELEQRPRELPDLHCVSVTGEAVKKELVQRWFAARPGIRLVNAYGLTETSDDTNHEVMRAVPEQARVPLGRPIANVRAYVVDAGLAPVPLGAPGEIVFSGVCVGRGYVNDPERTAAAFTADPYRPGERLYRSGDHGRWLPDGKLEFLGRRDSQVKVRGFRIELGEVESALLRVPGIRDGAVVVVRGTRLVAFCTGASPVEARAVRERLAASLPAYMVPSAVHWRDRLPLTANGKIDRRTLGVLAEQLGAVEGGPDTPDEHRMAAAWSQVLGIPADRIGRLDDFFDRGGTSLAAVRLVIALDRAVTLKDVTRHPVLADLAVLLGPTA